MNRYRYIMFLFGYIAIAGFAVLAWIDTDPVIRILASLVLILSTGVFVYDSWRYLFK